GEPFERDLRFPRNAPDFVFRRLGLRGTLIEEEWAAGIGKAEYPGVLHMLRQGEKARLDHEDPQTAARLRLAVPQVLGDGGAEGAAADDDHVERSSALAPPRLCLGEIIAEIAALDIFGKRSQLAGFRHCFPPRSVRDESSNQVAQDLLRV